MPPTVLVVDDEPDVAHAMELILTRAGFEVRTTGTAHAAHAAVRQAHPDVVVIDRGLPDMDGLDAVRLLRSDGYAGPVLVVSGYGGPEHVAASLAAGADTVLEKPFRLTEITELVRRAVDRVAVAEAG